MATMLNHTGSSRVSCLSFCCHRFLSLSFGFLLIFVFPAQLVLAGKVSNEDWDGAQVISRIEFVYPAVIASDAQGNAFAVWTQSDALPQEYGVWANRYDTKRGWGEPKRINKYTGQADELTIAMNNKGEAAVVWIQYSILDPNNPVPVTTSLWAATYSAKKGWSVPKQLVDDTLNPLFPKVAIDENAGVIVVWEQTNADLDITNIYAKRFDGRASWGEAKLLQADSGINSNNPQIAMNKKGDAVAVWGQIHTANNYLADIGFNYFTAKTGWSGGDSLPGSEEGTMAHAGIDEFGNAMAVFSKTYQGNVYASRFTKKQGWDVPLPLQDPNIGTDVSASNLQLAVNAGGEAFAIWKETAYSYFGDFAYSVHANRFVAGKGWQGQQMIGTEASNSTVYDQLVPQIGMDNQGNAIAVWAQEFGPDYFAPTNMLAFRFTEKQGWDTGQNIQKSTVNANNNQLSVTEKGEAFAVWIEQDLADPNGYTSLWANHLSK